MIESIVKILSIHQPFAGLVARGIKTIELRSWPTTHRGPLAIHTGRRLSPAADTILARSAIRVALGLADDEAAARWLAEQPRQAVVAVVELVTVEVVTPILLAGLSPIEQAAGTWTAGYRWAWRLTNPQPLSPPRPLVGRRGLWNWHEHKEVMP
jgi:hypothetical protein